MRKTSKAQNRKKTHSIDIITFVNKDDIDSIYFEKPYFLEPGKGADKAYALLLEALQRSKKVAVVKFVFKNRGHVGILKPYQNSILLNQMRFEAEVRNLDELKLPKKSRSFKERNRNVSQVSPGTLW